MIVVSLLLILVAVTLLVLGLAGGSSTLLIGSIVASLLAAVFLVIGARQAAARRRTAAVAPDGVPADAAHDSVLGETAAVRRRRPEPAMATASRSDASGETYVGGADPRDGGPRDGGPRDGDPRDGDPRDGGPLGGDLRDGDLRDGDLHDGDLHDGDLREDDAARPGDRRPEPDYRHASSVIGAARSDDDQSWRRDPQAGPPPSGSSAAGADATSAAGVSGDADEFAEPDDDDPADEPLPQAVRPGDAVRMARIDSEVLVVDGRPRYHVADCPHLVGRLTEPLPAREAVELGFSPCGLCRPVDRLIAQAAHH